MKRINSIIILLLGVFLSFSFVSCSSDDDDSNSSSFDSNNPQLGTWVYETTEHRNYGNDEVYDERIIRSFTFTKSSAFSMHGESYITASMKNLYDYDVNHNLIEFPVGKEVHYVWISETGSYVWDSESNVAAIHDVHDGSRASTWSIKFKFSPDFKRAYITFHNSGYGSWEGWYDRK